MKTLLRIALSASCLALCASQAFALDAFGYLFGQKTSEEHGFVTFDTANPQTLKFVGSKNYGDVHISAGEYVDGKLYTYRVEQGDYSELYPNSWQVYDVTDTSFALDTENSRDMSSNNRVVDMTFDYTTNTMYALVESKYSTGKVGATQLAVVDLKTGNYRTIADTPAIKAIDGYGKNVDDGMITIACDKNGQLYTMTHYRYLYKIDKFTGKLEEAAPRHNLGTAEQFQSMTFDADGHLWWAQTHPDYGHFCEIDLTTGIPGGFVDFKTDYPKLNKLGNDAQVTALFFKDKTVNRSAPCAVMNLFATAATTGINDIKLTWTLPTADYSGNDPALTGIRIYRMGTTEPIATLAPDATEYVDLGAPDGFVTYEVLPFNASGNGYPAFTKTFSGTDRLKAVNDLNATASGADVTVSWTKPTATVNAGYADYDAITYNIVRIKGSDRTPLAQGVADTTYADQLTESGIYTYEVTPVCNGVIGVAAVSPEVTYGTTEALPYSTSFEDDETGSPWIIKNCEANAAAGKGWAKEYSKYSALEGKWMSGKTGGKANPGDDWLFSPALDFKAGDYELEYWAISAYGDNLSYYVCLGTDPEDTSTFGTVLQEIKDENVKDSTKANNGWVKFNITFNVPADGPHHIAFHNVTTVTFASTNIDKLSIKAKLDAVETIETDNTAAAAETGRFDMQGRPVDATYRGVVIVRHADGSVSKLIAR